MTSDQQPPNSATNATVQDVVGEHLKRVGATGLCNESCGCEAPDLMPCDNCTRTCVPAARRKCGPDCEECGGDGGCMTPLAMKYKIWDCKIVVPMDAQLPEGFDSPPRRAAMDAVERAGIPVLACFSGWAGNLTPTQEVVVDGDMARRSNGGTQRRESAANDAQTQQPTRPADASSLEHVSWYCNCGAHWVGYLPPLQVRVVRILWDSAHGVNVSPKDGDLHYPVDSKTCARNRAAAERKASAEGRTGCAG